MSRSSGRLCRFIINTRVSNKCKKICLFTYSKNRIFQIYIELQRHDSHFNKKKTRKISVLVKQIVNSKRVKIRDVAKVLGTFEAALPSIKYENLHLFFLKKLKKLYLT